MNLAHCLPALQSSDLGPAFGAGRAVDGVISAADAAQTAFSDRPYWEVDLGAARDIDTIELTMPAQPGWLLVSETPFAGNDLASEIAQSSFALPVTAAGSFTVAQAGRFVRVQLTGTQVSLALTEVKVNQIRNLAQGKVAAQSSTAGDAGARRATDGIVDGDVAKLSVASTNTESEPWWEVNLDENHDIGDIVLWSATPVYPAAWKNLRVYVSSWGSSSGAVPVRHYYPALGEPGALPARKIVIPVRAPGSLVTIVLEDSTAQLRLAEVEVKNDTGSSGKPTGVLKGMVAYTNERDNNRCVPDALHVLDRMNDDGDLVAWHHGSANYPALDDDHFHIQSIVRMPYLPDTELLDGSFFAATFSHPRSCSDKSPLSDCVAVGSQLGVARMGFGVAA